MIVFIFLFFLSLFFLVCVHLDVCFALCMFKEREGKGMELGLCRGGEDMGGVGRAEKHNQSTLYEKLNFQKK